MSMTMWTSVHGGAQRARVGIILGIWALLAAVTLLPSSLRADQPQYHFFGRHFFAQYYDCDHAALMDATQLAAAMKQATLASGATILGTTEHVFEGGGYSMIILVSESHATIHTYPEYNACFVDLFTCGKKCSAERFDAALRAYLKPKRVEGKVEERR